MRRKDQRAHTSGLIKSIVETEEEIIFLQISKARASAIKEANEHLKRLKEKKNYLIKRGVITKREYFTGSYSTFQQRLSSLDQDLAALREAERYEKISKYQQVYDRLNAISERYRGAIGRITIKASKE